jgi:hypothetical protein
MGVNSTYLGCGVARKHNTPMVKIVVGHGKPNVGIMG